MVRMAIFSGHWKTGPEVGKRAPDDVRRAAGRDWIFDAERRERELEEAMRAPVPWDFRTYYTLESPMRFRENRSHNLSV